MWETRVGFRGPGKERISGKPSHKSPRGFWIWPESGIQPLCSPRKKGQDKGPSWPPRGTGRSSSFCTAAQPRHCHQPSRRAATRSSQELLKTVKKETAGRTAGREKEKGLWQEADRTKASVMKRETHFF